MSEGRFETLSCDGVRSQLDSYLDNELPAEINQRVSGHLETCLYCAAELKARMRVRTLLQRAVEGEKVPDVLRERIKHDVRAYRPIRLNSIIGSTISFAGERTTIAALAVIILCLVAGITFSIWSGRQDPGLQVNSGETVSDQIRRTLDIGFDDHVHCAINNRWLNRFFSSWFQELEPAYAGLLPLVEEKVGKDYRIVAAHHCAVDERQFVHFILQRGEATLSLALTKKDGESFPQDNLIVGSNGSDVPVYQKRLQGFAVAGFEAGQHLAFVISNLRQEENLQLAAHIAPSLRDFLTRLETTTQFSKMNL